MRALEIIESITKIGKSRKYLQTEININSAWHLWDHVISRYDVIEITQVLENFARDPDLKLVLIKGLEELKKQASELEKLMVKYGIPLPKRPPFASVSTINPEVITDEYIFRRVFAGIQSFIPVHVSAMIQSTSPELREEFKKFLIDEIKMYDKYLVYGQFKGWVLEPPAYRV